MLDEFLASPSARQTPDRRCSASAGQSYSWFLSERDGMMLGEREGRFAENLRMPEMTVGRKLTEIFVHA